MATLNENYDDVDENSVKEPSGRHIHEQRDSFRRSNSAGAAHPEDHPLHQLALSLDKACHDSEIKMKKHLTVETLKEEILSMKEQLKKIIDVQEDHIELLEERFRLGNFTVTMKRDLTALFDDEDYKIHFKGSCDRTKNHDIHGDVSGLHLRLTLRKRISKKNPKPILSGFIYFYPNVEEPGQTGIYCKSEIEFWGLPAEALQSPKKESPKGSDDEKSKEGKKKKKKMFGSFRSKKDKEPKQKEPKTPSTNQVPPDGKTPVHTGKNPANLSLDENISFFDPEKPGWQKLFDMTHTYSNDGEGFGKWNIMLWEQFKKRVVHQDGKVVIRMKVSNVERFFET